MCPKVAASILIEHNLCSIRLKEKLNEFLYNLSIEEDFKIYPDEEVLIPIEGFKNYLASSLGKVYSVRSKRYLKSFISNAGYEVVSLCDSGICKKFSIHRLVCFLKENLPIVDHIDGDKLNNNINNLRWSTNSFNQFNRYGKEIV